jgi:hypothetical protein
MKLAIVGSRSFNNYNLLKDTINKYDNIKLIINNSAIGADKLAEQYAKEYNIETKIYLPDWNKYGKKAGPIRNELIIKDCDIVIAFWDGESRGTLNSINIAKTLNKKLELIKLN